MSGTAAREQIAQGISDGRKSLPSRPPYLLTPPAGHMRFQWLLVAAALKWVWPIPCPHHFLIGPWMAFRTSRLSTCSLPRPPPSLRPEEGAKGQRQGGQHPLTKGCQVSTAQGGQPWKDRPLGRGKRSRGAASKALPVFPGTGMETAPEHS